MKKHKSGKKAGLRRGAAQAAVYLILIGIGFVYLYPILYMLVNSLLSPADLVDPGVTWLPTGLYLENYKEAFQTLDFVKSFGISMLMSLVPAVLQTMVAALVGYGLARFRFPFKRLLLVLILVTFLLPSQVMMVPRYVLFDSYHLTDTVWVQFLPAILGQGLNSAIFIVVYYQYFSSYPIALDEAAEIDGAGKFKIFTRIAMPMASGATILSMLFSFVFYWNETYQSNLMFGGKLQTLPLKLQSFTKQYEAIFGEGAAGSTNEAISLAGTFLSILPLLILYIVFQRQFVESIEASGITGE